MSEMESPNDSADMFANSSVETVTENISFSDLPPPPPEFANPMSPNSSYMVNQLISTTNSDVTDRFYCPFCCVDYAFDFLVKDHIKENHPVELKNVLRSNIEVDFYPCSFCHAKFYVRDLLPKHIIRKHETDVVEMFTGGTAESYTCGFCPHKVLKKHHKLLMVHLEKKHFKEFESYIFNKFSKIAMSCEDLVNFDGESQLTTQIVTPDKMRSDDKVIYARRNVLIKPILKATSSYSDENEPPEEVDHLMEVLSDEPPKRKLRFNLPESPKEDSLRNINMKIKHVFGKKKKKKSKFAQLFKGSSSVNTSLIPIKGSPIRTPTKGALKMTKEPVLYFKCGLCPEAFDQNANLVEHLRKTHKGFIIQPQYQCGDCKSKFFRNSFLVRHCWFHHKPLCLQNKNACKDL